MVQFSTVTSRGIPSLLAMLVQAATAQITFDGLPFAKTSVAGNADGQTVISQSQGAQILYKKEQTSPAPLVSVNLFNLADGSNYQLSKDFDMIAQKCSCYWIDLKTIPKVPDGRSYQLVFRATDGTDAPKEWGSGLFAIVSSNGTSVSGLPAPMIKEVEEKNAKSDENRGKKVIKVADPKVDGKDNSTTPANNSSKTTGKSSSIKLNGASSLISSSLTGLVMMAVSFMLL